MKRSRRFRTAVQKASSPARAPSGEASDQPMEMSVSVVVKGETRRMIEALPPETMRSVFAEALVASINKAAAVAHSGSPSEPESAARPQTRVFRRAILSKAETAEEERYVLGVVMEPDEVDTQGDTETAEEIRKAAFQFMESYRGGGDAGHMGLMHQEIVDDKLAILETYIQKNDDTIEGEPVKAGSWLMAIRVIDDEIWKQVKAGDLTGFSIGGTAVKTPLE